LTEYINFDDDDRKLVVITGMAGAIGALFPSPILTVLIFYELGTPPR
jgi:H+/Cl- antiporter ClcA